MDEEELLDDDTDLKDADNKDDELFGDNFDLGYNDYMDDNNSEPMQKHSELLKELTDFETELKEKVNSWLGRVWDEKQNVFVKDPHTVPIMNERGAKWCISFLKNYAKKPNIITHILKGDYNYLCEDIIEICWEEFATKCEEFGIKNNNDLKRVCVEIEHAAKLVLMGAGDGKYNKLLKESTQRTENVSYTNPMMQRNGSDYSPPRKTTGWNKFKSKILGGQ